MTEITGITMIEATTGLPGIGSSRESRSRNAKGAIYRVRPDGLWDTIWETADDWPFDLLIDPDGTLLPSIGF